MVNLPRILTLAYRSRMKTKNWHRLVRAMAMVVVFCTTYALILPAITMESGTVCGITAHSHTEQCYETATVLHSHDESCYSRTAICGIEEHPAHSHMAECTGFVPTLICELPEEGHRHNAACYSYEQGLVCELEESEGHTHSEACWQTDLICGLSENQEVSVTNLVCGMEEHVHVESCYPAPTETTAGETLPAMGNPNADVETESDWLESFASVELTEDWSENLLSLANSQLGYAESKYNLSHDQQGNIYGYTRYGAWYGQPYGPWDAKFIAFCLHYAGVEGIPYDADTEQWLETLTEEGLYQAKADHQPNPGDLVFLDRDYDEKADHAAILYQIQPETGILELIAGDWNHRVDRVEVDEAAVLGYVPLPQEPSEEENSSEHYVSVSEDGITAEVQLNTALPAGAELTVTPIGEESEGYAAMAAQIEEALSENIEKLTLLDLSFMVDGEYHSVSDNATVTLCFDGDIFAGRQVKVFHFTENGPTELNSTATTFSTFSLRDEAIQTQLTFETEGFSVFAVVEVVGNASFYEQVTNVAANALAGSYYILNNDSTAAMMAAVTTDNKYNYSALSETSVVNTNDLSGYTLWTLEPVSENSYKIYSTDAVGNKQYLAAQHVVSNGSEQPSWGLGALTLTTSEAMATTFSVTANNGIYQFAYSNRYITDLTDNSLENGTTPYGFTMHTWKATESDLRLYQKIPDTIVPLTGLDGRKYAIVNLNTRTRQFAMTSTHVSNGGEKLQAVPVTVINGQKYITGNGITEWEFTNAGDEGYYYIKATDTNKYLTFTGQGENITTSDTPQAILVAIDNTTVAGQITLRVDKQILNWIGANSGRGNIFGAWNGTDNNSRQTLCVVQNPLFYSLNPPASSWYRYNWDFSTPSIPATSQIIQPNTDNQTIYSVYGQNECGKFVADTLTKRSNVQEYYYTANTALRNAGTLTADNYLVPGAEYVFLGWQATINGTTHLFPEGAAISIDDNGDFRIADTDGNMQTVPVGTTLVGQWKQVSNAVLFFVNHGDTMLNTEKTHPITDFESPYYTDVVAIGHIYNPVPYNAEIDKTIRLSIHENISNEIVPYHPYFDPSEGKTEVVIDAVRPTFGSAYTPAPNFTNAALEDSVGSYLRTNTDKTKQIKLGNATIDQNAINTTNYGLYWYSQKEEDGDAYAYHIDGVLVAKTAPMKIIKTFSGLADGESEQILGINPDGTALGDALDENKKPNYMNFPLHLVHTDENGSDIKDYYTTLIAGIDEEGVFTNDHYDSGGDIYRWTLNSVLGQRYTFEEEKYNPLKDSEGKDKYDHSSLISVHYVGESEPKYVYNTQKTYTDTETVKNTVTNNGTTTTTYTHYIEDRFEGKPLIGGEVERVIFANFYTPRGTGMFSITKVSALNEQDKLKDAVFTLTMVKDADDTDITDGTVLTQTTNENGAGHFSGLIAGTYLLQETKAPSGYQELSTRWYVEVDPDDNDNDKVTVKIWKTTDDKSTAQSLYTTEDGIQQVFVIPNEPTSKTVTVNKYFKNISTSEIAELKEDDYRIEVQKSDGTVVKTLKLEDAAGQPDGGHQWVIELEGAEGNGAIDYTFVEKGYLHEKYIDTVVTATIGGEPVEVKENDGQTEAKFTLVKDGKAKAVTITNSYTNEFTLKIQKVDATSNDTPMKDVTFKVYTDLWTDSIGGDPYYYTDQDGNVHTFWYKGTTDPTNSEGITEYTRLQISDNTTKEILYMITEVSTPDGYLPLDEPIVEMVTIDTKNYEDGVYTLVVKNYKPELATVKVTATKQWELPKGMSTVPVTLTLYKKTGDTVTEYKVETLNSETGWVAEWKDLPYWDENASVRNEYYVAETPMDGYNTSYNTHVSTNSVGTQQIEMALAEGYNLKRYVTITNSSGYELPSTGSLGVGWIYILGLGLMGAALWLHRLDVIKKRQGGMDSS